MARPTQSRALYQQCIGRGLRVCPELNKEDCLVLDVTDNCRRHQLMTVFDLFGTANVRNARGADVLEVVRTERARPVEVEEPRRWPWLSAENATVTWGLEEVQPWPVAPTLDGYRPTTSWERQPATVPQLRYLEGLRLRAFSGITRGEASYLIEQCKRYELEYPTAATERQEWFLKTQGRWVDGMTKQQATGLIAEIKRQEQRLAAWTDRP
jgi:superfamily II DNA or RNA helicase